MIRCSRVGQYIECTGKITVRKIDDKLYYMQYDFVALYLSFFVCKSWFYFPYNKENDRSLYYGVFYHDMVPPTDVS